jgi:hypothetical protein
MKIIATFDYLKAFKGFPSYQLERRVDAFILPYLEKAFNDKLETDDVIFLYPEFPLWPKNKDHYELNKDAERSAYADYLLWSKKNGTIYLVEFKTDHHSVKQSQFDTYILNCMQGWEKLLIDFIEKASKSSYWRKYCHGLEYLFQKAPEIFGYKGSFEVAKFYNRERGQGVTEYLNTIKKELKFEKIPELKIIYLAPENSLNKINASSSDAKRYYQGIFPLSEFAEYTDEPLKGLLRNISNKK